MNYENNCAFSTLDGPHHFDYDLIVLHLSAPTFDKHRPVNGGPEKGKTGVKKSKNFHLSPGQVHENFYLSCYQITCSCQGKIY